MYDNYPDNWLESAYEERYVFDDSEQDYEIDEEDMYCPDCNELYENCVCMDREDGYDEDYFF